MDNNTSTFFSYMSDEFPINIIEGGISSHIQPYYDGVEKNEYYLFEFVYRGRGVLTVGNKSVTISSGDMYIIPKNQTYECYFGDSETSEHYWFFGYGKLLDILYELYGGKKSYLLASENFIEEFKEIFSLMRIYDNSKDAYANFADKIFRLYTKVKMNEVARDVIESTPLPLDAVAGKIKSYIFSNCKNKFSLGELSKSMSLSKNQIINIFKKAYATTPQVYYMRQKLDFAEILLKKGKNCREVSELLNFCDEQYFTKMFKKFKGILPSKVLKNHQN